MLTTAQLSSNATSIFQSSKLRKRFQLQTNEISNFIVASLDTRFSFSTSQNRRKMTKNDHFQHLKMNTFSFYFAILYKQRSHSKIEIYPEIFPKQQKASRLPLKSNKLRDLYIEQSFPFELKFNPKSAIFPAVNGFNFRHSLFKPQQKCIDYNIQKVSS